MYRKGPARLAALTLEPYRVTQENCTECPGTGAPLADFFGALQIDVAPRRARSDLAAPARHRH